jgi:hypothetical protein
LNLESSIQKGIVEKGSPKMMTKQNHALGPTNNDRRRFTVNQTSKYPISRLSHRTSKARKLARKRVGLADGAEDFLGGRAGEIERAVAGRENAEKFPDSRVDAILPLPTDEIRQGNLNQEIGLAHGIMIIQPR